MHFLSTLVVVIHDTKPGPFWLLSALAALLALALLYGALRSFNRKRMIENMPTAMVRSAAQGYTELRGMAELMDGDPIRAPASLRKCAWFKYKIEHYEETGHGRDRRKNWVVVDKGESDSLFNLTDTSGSCAVDPDGAEVHATQRDVWYGQSPMPGCFRPSGDSALSRWFFGIGKEYRYTEHLILPGHAIYVIGQFTTHGGSASAPLDKDDSVAERLRAWKRDQGALLREFDANRDGKIDAEEWEAVRRRVEQEVHAEREQNVDPPPVDVIGRTRDRRWPFVISAAGEDGVIAFHRRMALTLLTLGAPVTVLVLWAWMVRLG
jgi:hypothetical protein